MASPYLMLCDLVTTGAVKSQAVWSKTNPESLLVFVHGFAGDSISTWTRFSQLVYEHPRAGTFDAVFYQYDGVYSSVVASAGLLRDFIGRMLFSAPSVINSTGYGAIRPVTFAYQRAVFVAHSLGAVVLRRALLDLAEQVKNDAAKASWMRANIRNIHYAPADRGARAAEAVEFILTQLPYSLGRIAGRLTMLQVPAVEELQEGSSTLADLFKDTHDVIEELKKRGEPLNHAIAHDVIFAEKEHITLNRRFSKEDAMFRTLPGASHTSVCKPATTADERFEPLLKAL